MAGTVDSQGVNMNEFIRTRLAMSPEQVTKMVTHHGVVREYQARTKQDYPKTTALEEALTEMFCGGLTSTMRVYQTLATQENVDLIESHIKGELMPVEGDLEIPDLIEVKRILHRAEDIALISQMLVAERAGKNAVGTPREAVVKLLSAKIRELATPEPAEKPRASKADIEDLASDE